MGEVVSLRDVDDLEHRISGAKSLGWLLRNSDLQRPYAIKIDEKSLEDDVPEMPRFPSGIDSDFDAVYGGLQALTILAGRGGSGKSVAAMACALSNVHQEEGACCVCYVEAGENAQGQQKQRVIAWYGGAAQFLAGFSRVNGVDFHWIDLEERVKWTTLMHHCSERLSNRHKRVLLIVDSVQSLARIVGHPKDNPLQTATSIYWELNRLARSSGGKIGVLALSELNKGGDVKGLEGVHIATMALKIEKLIDRGENFVRIEMEKNRNGRCGYDLGEHEVKWWLGRVVKDGGRDS